MPGAFMLGATAAAVPEREGLLRYDISIGTALHPVPVINQVDDERFPRFFIYSNQRKEDLAIAAEHQVGCACPPGGCKKGSCACLDRSTIELTRDARIKNTSFRPGMFTGLALHECSRLNCACGAACANRLSPLTRRLHHRVEIYKHAQKGFCCRTQAGYPIRKGEYICDFIGDVLDVEECGRRNSKAIGEYSMEVSIKDAPPFTIDPYSTGNVSRFMPHACFPNIVCVRYFNDHHFEERPHVGLVAVRDIPPLTDLCIDYGATWWVDGGREFPCACGWKYCRYRLPGTARRLSKAQQRDEEELKRKVRSADHETVRLRR